jgi:acetyl-CoA carboxylase carboxyl transferase subunit alpha
MSNLCVPVISVFIGEGGSGGALALAVADQVWMLENAVYSVISPEGCASILWKDAKKAETAAESLKLTAADAKRLGIIERIIPETGLGDTAFYDRLRVLLTGEIKVLGEDPDLITKRFARFRRIGTAQVEEAHSL